MNARFSKHALCSVLLILVGGFAAGADWPTYQGDYARSGISREVLARSFTEIWRTRSPRPPRLAWPGSAKWDGYHKVEGLKDRMVFDSLTVERLPGRAQA